MMFRKTSSSEELLKRFENLYKEGPKVRYTNPEAWIRPLEKANSLRL